MLITKSMSVAALLSLTLGLAACGSTPPSSDTLIHAYFQSTTVKNDRDRGSNSADRIAEFAAEGSAGEIVGALFDTRSCGSADNSADDFTVTPPCPPNASVDATAARFTGSAGTPLNECDVLVQHDGGQLELMPIYIARNATGATELIDTSGQAYPGGITDFSQHSSLVAANDQIVAPGDITATSGPLNLKVYTAHDGPSVALVLGIVALAVAAAGVTFAVLRIRRRRTGTDGAHLA